MFEYEAFDWTPVSQLQVERMLNDKEALENIITATPGLDRDPVAVGEWLNYYRLIQMLLSYFAEELKKCTQ